MSHARIAETYWTDPKIRRLSPEGKLLFLYLLSNPHRHYSGIYYLPTGLIPIETGLKGDTVKKELSALTDSKILLYDAETETIFIRKMFRYQAGWGDGLRLTDKQKIGAVNHLKSLHQTCLIDNFLKEYSNLNLKFETPSKPHRNPTRRQSQSQSQSQYKRLKDLSTEPLTTHSVNSLNPDSLGFLWNEIKPPELSLVNLPLKRPPKDLAKIKDAIKRNPDKAWWEKVILRLHQSPHCRGKNDRGWKANFDFMVTRAEMILDGKYDGVREEPKGFDGIRNWLTKQGETNG